MIIAFGGGLSSAAFADDKDAPATPPAKAPAETPPKPGGAPVPPPPLPTPSAKEILARYEKALGGREAWLTQSSRTIRWLVDIDTPNGPGGAANKMKGVLEVKHKAPNRMVSTLSVEGMGDYRQGFDGKEGWSIGIDGRTRRLAGAELAERKRESIIDREIRLDELYDRIESMGDRELNGKRCWLVRLTSDDGGFANAWFDMDTGLLVAFSRRLESMRGTITVLQNFSDYKVVEGRSYPGKIVQIISGTTQTHTLESVICDPLPDELFVMPPSTAGGAPTTTSPAGAPTPPPSAPPPPGQ